MTKKTYNILILGASYGSLLGVKLALAGHHVHLVCLPAEADLINAEGSIIRMPIRGRTGLVELDSRKAPGRLTASSTANVKPQDYDLVGLAMQEPQYRSPGVRELLAAVAAARVPCMSIMNMPPLPYLRRIPGLNADACRNAFTESEIWDGFDPALVTLCSPDPQAFRPPEDKVNVLQVRLPTNFKAARFDSDAHTQMLRDMEAGIDSIRFDMGDGVTELPVKLRVHDSIYVPLAKWAMLITGNYRCVQKDSMRSIKEAVHSDLKKSQDIYQWVVDLCVSMGANAADMVPFEKYAAAANGLESPSSAARALFGGAQNIERVDRLVQSIAAAQGLRLDTLDEVVALVDERLELNRQSAK